MSQITTFVSNIDTIDFCKQLDILNPVEGLDCGFDESGQAVIEYMVTIDAYPQDDSRESISASFFQEFSPFTLSEETRSLDLTEYQSQPIYGLW